MWDDETLLHLNKCEETAREILTRGAGAVKRNEHGETPSHHAVSYGRELEVVIDLLTCGDDINIIKRDGNPQLDVALRHRCRNLDIIKDLCDYGADTNVGNLTRRSVDDQSELLENAAGYVEYVRLLTKVTLIKYFDRVHRKIIGLAPYDEDRIYDELSSFRDYCLCEVVQMKAEDVNCDLSLFEFMVSEDASGELLCTNNEGGKNIADQVFVMLSSSNYPAYHPVISDKIKKDLAALEKAVLLNKLSDLQVYTLSDVSSEDVEEKKVILDTYSSFSVAKFLTNDDLVNLIIAFHDSDIHTAKSSSSSNNLAEFREQSDERLDETSTSGCAKRARLESPC